jgi:hypothetical protein
MSVLDDIRRAKAAREVRKGLPEPERYEQYEKYEQIPPATIGGPAVLHPSNSGQLCDAKSEHPREPGSAPDCPEIDIPASGWRWAVASGPEDRWFAWRRAATARLREGATVGEIDAVEESVYRGMTAPAGPGADRFDPAGFHDRLFARRVAVWSTSDGRVEWHDADGSLTAVEVATIAHHRAALVRWLTIPPEDSAREATRKT